MSKQVRIALGIALVATLSPAMFGQEAQPARFEVATIKPAPPITAATVAGGRIHVGIKSDGAQVDIGYSSLADLIRAAYDVRAFQVSGPEWLSDKRWDILAKLPDGAAAKQIPQMLQVLLAERFGLKVHREKRERPVYALVIAPGGAKLKASSPAEPEGDRGGRAEVQVRRDGNTTVSSGGGWGATKTEVRPDGSMHVASSGMTLATLADSLTYYLDRPMIDLTQLSGSYVIDLEYSAADLRYAAAKSGGQMYLPDAARSAEGASEPVGASLITSVQKLGLRLERQQASLEILVIDHVETSPTEN